MTLNEEKALKAYIKNYIRENFFNNNDTNIYNNTNSEDVIDEKKVSKKLKNKIAKKSEHNKHKKKSSSEQMKNKRTFVLKRLKNDDVNSASYMRKLWHPSKDEEDSARSYFYKCRDGELNDSGVPYSFSDDEINRLYQLLNKN